MKKKFNVTGICYPEQHYMMDNNNKLSEVMELIEFGEYFTINRPRQYGKTTTLHFLTEKLKKSENYLVIRLTFEDVRDASHQSDDAFAEMFVGKMTQAFKRIDQPIYKILQTAQYESINLLNLSSLITDIAHATNKKLVLLIDEVDASSNYLSFLKFLAMLRTKYLNRMSEADKTFHSIILVGVHDIKSLKYKLRHEDAQYNSPWNIATDFKVDMSFNPKEIAPMLEQYSVTEGVEMDIAAVAERLHYHTAGYPFLVSRLCKIVAEEILPKREVKTLWTLDDIEEAVQILLLENNTNFDSLIKNLENHQDLYDLTFRILIDGDKVAYNPDNSVIKMGILYGVFKRNGHVKIHNRIYEQRIYNYMASNMEVGLKKAAQYNFENQFYLPDNVLDVEKILLKFQEFMKMEYSDKDQDFLEREWRLIFLAFIRPIVNGSGYTFKEPQISQEKRLDVVITFFQRQYIAELKRWNGTQLHEEGVKQLADYLNLQNQTKGFLVIFEYLTAKTWRKEWIQYEDKEIFAVWI